MSAQDHGHDGAITSKHTVLELVASHQQSRQVSTILSLWGVYRTLLIDATQTWTGVTTTPTMDVAATILLTAADEFDTRWGGSFTGYLRSIVHQWRVMSATSPAQIDRWVALRRAEVTAFALPEEMEPSPARGDDPAAATSYASEPATSLRRLVLGIIRDLLGWPFPEIAIALATGMQPASRRTWASISNVILPAVANWADVCQLYSAVGRWNEAALRDFYLRERVEHT